jgi:hypothetical protein
MALEVGFDEDDYLIDYAIPSQQPHSSPVHAKSFHRGVNVDQSALISTEESNELLLSYAARALPHLGNVVREVLTEFQDGARVYELEKCAEQINELVTKLATSLQGRGAP